MSRAYPIGELVRRDEAIGESACLGAVHDGNAQMRDGLRQLDGDLSATTTEIQQRSNRCKVDLARNRRPDAGGGGIHCFEKDAKLGGCAEKRLVAILVGAGAERPTPRLGASRTN